MAKQIFWPDKAKNVGIAPAKARLLHLSGVLNLSIRDIFASRIDERFTNQPNFSVYSFRQRGRFITFGFSYGFGKGEAMEFSGQKRRGGFGGGRRR